MKLWGSAYCPLTSSNLGQLKTSLIQPKPAAGILGITVDGFHPRSKCVLTPRRSSAKAEAPHKKTTAKRLLNILIKVLWQIKKFHLCCAQSKQDSKDNIYCNYAFYRDLNKRS